jgi:hypothetical protein
MPSWRGAQLKHRDSFTFALPLPPQDYINGKPISLDIIIIIIIIIIHPVDKHKIDVLYIKIIRALYLGHLTQFKIAERVNP